MPSTTEDVLEIRYRPNARILDHRGEWAEALAAHMSLAEWNIIENRIDIFSTDKTQHIFVGFRNAGIICLDSPTANFFSDKAQRFLRRLFDFPDFDDPVLLERLGVRHRAASQFDGTFDELVGRFISRYVGLSQGLTAALADANLLDVGAPLNFSDVVGKFNTQAGPMLEDQFKTMFRKRDGLPAVGLFTDIDYFVAPAAPVARNDLVAKGAKLISEARRRTASMQNVVLGL
jgi:hypothetical protein